MWYFPIQNTEHDWQFRSEPSDKACRSIKNGCFWPRGKMLGGCHGLNGVVYMRGNKADYDGWEALGNPTWDFDNVLEYFKKSELNANHTFVNYQNGKWHSDRGEMMVKHYHQTEEMRSVFTDAAKEFGYDFVHDLNADISLGYANAQGTLRDGRRESTAAAFLKPAKNRKNLHVIKYAHVTKVLFDSSNTAIGVEFTYNKKQKLVAKAKKETILSAGAVSTPQLLMLSGIGPKKHLKKLGIKVKKDLPVGKNLQDHLIVPVVFQFHKSTAQPEDSTALLDDLYNFAIHRKGRLSGIGTINLVGLVNTENHTGYPDIELQHFNQHKQSPMLKTLLYAMDYEEEVIKPILAANNEGETNMVYVELLRPKSTGEILLRSKDPKDAPIIIPNYLTEDEDVKTLIRGIRYQANFENTKTFKKHEGKLVRIPFADCDKHEYMSDKYWICYMSHLATTVYHPVGTTWMSDTHPDAVLDSQLRVKGIKRLRVIDAGSIPKQVSGNPNAAVIMVAEKGADFIRNKWLQKNVKQEL